MDAAPHFTGDFKPMGRHITPRIIRKGLVGKERRTIMLDVLAWAILAAVYFGVIPLFFAGVNDCGYKKCVLGWFVLNLFFIGCVAVVASVCWAIERLFF